MKLNCAVALAIRITACTVRITAFAVALVGTLGAQSYSGSGPVGERIVRAPIWVYLEPVPGNVDTGQTNPRTPPLPELKNLSRFVLEGMVFGWRVVYTPPDRARAVAEYFEMVPLARLPENDERLKLTELRVRYPFLETWAELTIDGATARHSDRWQSVIFRTVQGRGTGERTAETEGIRDAYRAAVLNAVREHARSLEKNKPKEIHADLLLRGEPRLHVDQGWFVANLRLILHIKEIVPYRSW